MLKACFVSTTNRNFINKACGEIFCQAETSFTIICKECDIKIFDYNEFIEHFRSAHWPEICDNKKITQNNYDLKQDSNDVKIENNSGGEDERNIGHELNELILSNSDNQDEDYSDLEDLVKPLTVLDKSTSSVSNKQKRFECQQCKRKFSTKFYLRFHMRQQHEPKNFECDKCEKTFVEKRYLTLHQRSHIGYTCPICNKLFDKYEALRYHSESHIESRNFVCDYENCGKAFPNNRRLSAHKRSHFTQPAFVCEICGSRQRSKEFLIVHIRTHTGEKPYACTQCERRFASKHFLQDHQSVHATERSHVCTTCGKAFASSKSLYHHRHLHSSIKKYVCKICNSAYSQASGLSAHMRKHKQDSGLLEIDPTEVGESDNNTIL